MLVLFSVKTCKYITCKKNVFHFQNFWIRFIFNIVISGNLVKSTVGMINLAEGQNLFEMLICLRGLPMF